VDAIWLDRRLREDPPTPSLALHQADGLTWLSLDGDTDPEYMIQASPDLTHWVDPSTNTIWDGPIADPRSTALAHCFYRVLEP
jgi:hypothetical protein